MIEVIEAINIARENNKGLRISKYMDSGLSFIFPVETPNGGDGTTFFYEVNKSSGDHGILADYWYKLMTDPGFGEAVKDVHEVI